MQSFNMINVAHTLLLDKVKQAKIMLDATCGNGFDTLFLSKNSLSQAEIYAFDIQPESEDIEQADFLALKMNYKPGRLIIGNPPFGSAIY